MPRLFSSNDDGRPSHLIVGYKKYNGVEETVNLGHPEIIHSLLEQPGTSITYNPDTHNLILKEIADLSEFSEEPLINTLSVSALALEDPDEIYRIGAQRLKDFVHGLQYAGCGQEDFETIESHLTSATALFQSLAHGNYNFSKVKEIEKPIQTAMEYVYGKNDGVHATLFKMLGYAKLGKPM